MNALLYILGIFGSVALSAVLFLMGMESGLDELLPFAPLPLLGAVIINSVMLNKMWSAIEGPEARMSGGAAGGLIWVPFFNAYWIFQVLPGFATDYNRVIAARGLRLPRLPWGLFLTSLLLSPIPLVGWILQSVVIVKICRAVNALKDAESRQSAERRPVRRRKRPPAQPVKPIILDDE